MSRFMREKAAAVLEPGPKMRDAGLQRVSKVHICEGEDTILLKGRERVFEVTDMESANIDVPVLGNVISYLLDCAAPSPLRVRVDLL